MKKIVYQKQVRNVHKDSTGKEYITFHNAKVFLDSIRGKYTVASSAIEFIFFYMPWCPYCKMVYEGKNSEWDKFQKLAKQKNVLCRKVDCTDESNADYRKFKDYINGYPTFIMISANAPPQKYEGDRTAVEFMSAVEIYRNDAQKGGISIPLPPQGIPGNGKHGTNLPSKKTGKTQQPGQKKGMMDKANTILAAASAAVEARNENHKFVM